MALFFSTISNLVAPNICASDSSIAAVTTDAGDSGTGINLVATNRTGIEDGVTAATRTTATDVAKAVLTAVPDASVTDNNDLNVTDTAAVSTSAVGAIIGTAGIASSSGTNVVTDNITGIEGGIIAATTTSTADVARNLSSISTKGIF